MRVKQCYSCNKEFKPSSNHKLCPSCRFKSYKKVCPICKEKLIFKSSKSCINCSNKFIDRTKDSKFIACKFTLKKCRNRWKDKPIKEIDIDEQYLINLLELQEGRCAYTGLPMSLPNHSGCSDKRLCASLDRIDSSIGYVKDNVQWVIAPINYMKNNMSDSDMKELVSWLKSA